jgi:predicted nucleotidyltransferase
MTVQDISNKIIPTLKNQGVLKAALFGSVVRGEAKKGSDVDLLVNLADDKSLLDLVALKLELEDVLKTKVDVLTYDAIYPPLKNIILNEQQVIYEKRS